MFRDKLLNYCLGISLAVNLLFILLVGSSDIFQSSIRLADLHPKPIKMFKPIPVKPKPKPKEIKPPPPPKPRPPLKPPPPLHIPRPTPHPVSHPHVVTRPHPSVQPVHTPPIQVATTTNKNTTTPFTTPAAAPADTGKPMTPGTDKGPPDKAPPVVAQQDPPVVEHHDPPAVVEHHDPPLPVHKAGWTPVDEQEAAPIGDYPSLELPDGLDIGSLSSTTVTVTWDVDESGKPVNIHVQQRSGNSDVDEACKRVIQKMRFKPAIQGHYPQVQQMSRDFALS